jgi:hypothetical protein
MRLALLVFMVVNWLLPQTGGSARRLAEPSTTMRLVPVRVSLVEMQRELSELSAKMTLFLALETVVGILLLGAACKALGQKQSVAPSPGYAHYPPHAAWEFRHWQMEALARCIAQELRRDEEDRRLAKLKQA